MIEGEIRVDKAGKRRFEVDVDIGRYKYEQMLKGATPEQVEAIKKVDPFKEWFFPLKRQRRPKKDGDVFVFSLDGKTYYYGKILIAAGIKLWEDCPIVVIFNETTDGKNMNGFRGDWSDLLVEPMLVGCRMWTIGCFETVGNVPLTKYEQNLDLGFAKDYYPKGLPGPRSTYFLTLSGEYMDHLPKYVIIGGTTDIGVFRKVVRQLILREAIDYKSGAYATTCIIERKD